MAPSLSPALSSLLALAACSALPTALAARSDYPEFNRTQALAHPELDAYNPLKYIPSIPLAAVATALYALTSAALAWLCFKTYKGQKWMLTLIISTLCYAFGMAVRIWFRQNTHASGVYIILYLFTTLAPCGMLATDYILLGRLVRHLGMDKHLLVNARKTTIIFVGSDVATFLIQAAGGGTSTAKGNPALIQTGTKIFLAGIILQMISFFFFTVLTLHFAYKIRKHEPALWHGTPSATGSHNTLNPTHWKHLLFALLWTCIGFLIRSFFRSVELSQGYGGHLSIHEKYIYGLDTLPLFVACITYIPFYPGKYLRPGVAGAHEHAYDGNGVLKTHAVADEDLPVVEEKPRKRRGWFGKRRGGE